jgi:predicted site-specific integrase-resolvase
MRKRDRYLRPEELGAVLNVEPPVVEEIVRTGQIRTIRLPNGDLRFDPRSVQDFLLACELDVRTHFVGVVSTPGSGAA